MATGSKSPSTDINLAEIGYDDDDDDDTPTLFSVTGRMAWDGAKAHTVEAERIAATTNSFMVLMIAPRDAQF
jgi:hypothetical protein